MAQSGEHPQSMGLGWQEPGAQTERMTAPRLVDLWADQPGPSDQEETRMKATRQASKPKGVLVPLAALIALGEAARTGAWDRKPRRVQRFRIVGYYGEGTELVVPTAAWWAFRSAEKDAARGGQDRLEGNAA